MQSFERRPAHPVRWFVSFLVDTGPVGNGSWRWSWRRVLAWFGPGSVPIGLYLALLQDETVRTNFHMPFGPVVAAMTGAAVVLARFRPLWALVLVVAGTAWTTMGGTDGMGLALFLTTPTILALLVVQFAIARDCRLWVSVGIWLAGVLAAVWVTRATDLDAEGIAPSASALTAVVLLLGLSVRISRQARVRVAEEERVATAERARRRMLEERTRIARELHDIVAHHMSVITVQALTAEYRVEGLSDDAREEFRSISAQARESLAEMRRLLGVLRSDDQAGERAPQPGPEGLEGLVESVSRSGTPVNLTVRDVPEQLPETLALTVFRVVQEALSNVVRHAAGTATDVEVVGDGSTVAVTVSNAPPAAGGTSPEPDGAGLGLVGMRERVVLEGGTLETGPTESGGFRVHAELPTDLRSTAQEQTT